MINRIY